MVSLNVNAEAKANVQGSEDGEKYPIVAEIKGAGKNGSHMVMVGGESPVSARIGGDAESPIAIAVPELTTIAEAISKMADGIKIAIDNEPMKIALGRIPVDLTVSVTSPKDESVLTVNIKGTIGD